jgi:very-short-patch-repair endonuclease
MTNHTVSTDISQCQSVSTDVNRFQSSPIEDRLAEALDHLGVPYERQYEFGSWTFDFAMPEAQLFIECHGYQHHRDKEQFDRDTRKEQYAQMRGWSVLPFTGSQINWNVMACAAQILAIREQRVSVLDLAVSKALCGEFAFPRSVP